MPELNAVHKLALFYVNGKKFDETLTQKFWEYDYGYTKEDILKALKEHSLVTDEIYLDRSLSGLKNTDLKEILKEHELPTSGKKDDLLKRIKENEGIINFSSLPKTYILTNAGQKLKEESAHIMFFQKEIHDIDIFEAEKIAKKSPESNSLKIIEKTISQKIDESKKEERFDSVGFLYNRLARLYIDQNMQEKEMETISLAMLATVLNEVNYKVQYNIEPTNDSRIIGYDKDLHTKFKSLSIQRDLSEDDLLNYLINKSSKLISEEETRKLISYITYLAINSEDNEIKDVLKSLRPVSNKKNNNSSLPSSVEQKSGGCLMFFALPIIGLLHAASNLL